MRPVPDTKQYEEITYEGDGPVVMTADEYRTLIGYFNTLAPKLNKLAEKQRALPQPEKKHGHDQIRRD